MGRFVVTSERFPGREFPKCDSLQEACFVVWYYTIHMEIDWAKKRFTVYDMGNGDEIPPHYLPEKLNEMILREEGWLEIFEQWLKEKTFGFS